MNLVDWLINKRPGTMETFGDRIEIMHESGGLSTVWLKQDDRATKIFGDVAEFYKDYDGADLFGSTFKIAALGAAKEVDNVEIVFSIDEIQKEFEDCNVSLPELASAFMYEAGMGIYCASHQSQKLFRIDSETSEITQHESLQAVIQDWIDAMDD